MESLERAMARIKELECPTGQVEERIQDIMDDYGVASRNDVHVKREEEYDRDDGAQGYSATLTHPEHSSMVVLAKSGMDDYVAKVVDVYLK